MSVRTEPLSQLNGPTRTERWVRRFIALLIAASLVVGAFCFGWFALLWVGPGEGDIHPIFRILGWVGVINMPLSLVLGALLVRRAWSNPWGLFMRRTS